MHDILNPATEEVIATIHGTSRDQVDAAVLRAHRAQRGWAAAAPADRARLLRRFAAVVDEHVEELARLEVREAGHTIGNARWEAGNVRDLLDYAAGGVERLTGRQIPVAAWASTSRSSNPSASSVSSRPGTSPCRSPRGARPRRSPPGTR